MAKGICTHVEGYSQPGVLGSAAPLTSDKKLLPTRFLHASRSRKLGPPPPDDLLMFCRNDVRSGAPH